MRQKRAEGFDQWLQSDFRGSVFVTDDLLNHPQSCLMVSAKSVNTRL